MTTNKSNDKFSPPPWIVKPKLENCGLKVMKEGKRIQTITEIGAKSYVLFGRNAAMSDIKLEHPSISRRHALMGHGSSGNLYVMDLGSSHGTFVNSIRLKKRKREPLRDGYTVKFGASTREYIVKLDLDIDDTNNNNNKPKISKKRKLDMDDKTNGSRAKKAKIDKVSCRHLLVKHVESRRPSSWKSESITRSKEEAVILIEKNRKDIMECIENKNNDNVEDNELIVNKFIQLAKSESDCNSYKRGGDLGAFGRGRMQKPFENAAFQLVIGQLSQPVHTDSGVHLILRYA